MHANARLTPIGRLTLCLRIEQGRPVAHVAPEMVFQEPLATSGGSAFAKRASRAWWIAPAGPATALIGPLQTSRPRSPNCAPSSSSVRPALVTAWGWRPRPCTGSSSASASIDSPGCDRPTGRVIRRYERARPGELIHVDIKKLGKIPDGGGWKVLGRTEGKKNNNGMGSNRVGYGFIHSAVDDHSRLAYSEILSDERQETAVAFWRRAHDWFSEHGVAIEEVLTDNGACYRSRLFAAALAEIKHRKTRPYRPQTNGKVERFNRTMLEEWAYVKPYASEEERRDAFGHFLHLYNHHRSHSALGGKPPISRVNNLAGHYN
jgi:Integrase core domain